MPKRHDLRTSEKPEEILATQYQYELELHIRPMSEKTPNQTGQISRSH